LQYPNRTQGWYVPFDETRFLLGKNKNENNNNNNNNNNNKQPTIT
jgi:hypothetical protein